MFVSIFLIFALSIAAIMWLQARAQEVEYIDSAVDGRTYLVRRLPDSDKAADELAKLNADATKLIQHLMAKYGTDESVKRLYDRYNPDALSEGSPESGYTSYSIAKGKKIVMCIRQKDNSFVDHNTLMYVLVHELGHVMTKSVGHSAQFWKNFRFILREAVAVGVYARVDYAETPEDFCGIKISSTVL